MGFNQDDWDHCYIIIKIIILTKQGSDTIHTVIPTKYQKHPSTTILKDTNVLAKVYKLPSGDLPNITPHDAYSIPIHVRTVNVH